MRALAMAVLALAFVPSASAGIPLPVEPEAPVYAEVTQPSDGCPDCVGAYGAAWTPTPAGCYDCDGVGAGAGASTDGDSVTAQAAVCKGGFVHFCVVDEEVTV